MNAEHEMATSDGLGGEESPPQRRWAMVVVVEANNADAAYNRLDDLTLDAGCRDVVYLGDPCPMCLADGYDTDGILMLADGEKVTTAPGMTVVVLDRAVEAVLKEREGLSPTDRAVYAEHCAEGLRAKVAELEAGEER